MDVKKAAKEVKTLEKTRNVAELDKLDLSLDFKTFEGLTNEGETFSFNYVEVEEVQYRVPKSVLQQIQTILEDNPDVKSVKVTKKGEGLSTTYQVIPK